MKFNPPIIKSFNKAPSVKSFMILVSMTILSLMSQNVVAQSVSVDISKTPTELVDILMDASCSIRSNQNISSAQSVGYFSGNGSNFPISQGVIIRNGKALLSQGAYTGQNLSSQVTTNGDADLQSISDSSGQLASILDVGYLEFDFVPNGNQFNFNFLFASNEYGQWQCGFSDVFAFLLTDLTTGETRNLAVIPGTSTPVSVKDIRDTSYNSSCNSVNAHLFSTYNVDNPSLSAVNMKGYTVVMNASSAVVPGNTYRIKLAIGDYNDSDFDSAVFIEAGSFTSFVNLGEDQTLCGNDQVLLDTNISDTTNYTFTWTKNGATIPGASGTALTVTEVGTYGVTIMGNNGCVLTDEVVINDLQIGVPSDITTCDNGNDTVFDLTLNNENALGVNPDQYEVLYFNSIDNANNNVPIASDLLTAYPSSGGETIYIKLRDKNSGNFCNSLQGFNLIASNFEVGNPDDLSVCENILSIDIISMVQDQILNGLNPAEYTVSYHTSLDDANTGDNAISTTSDYATPTSLTTLWARTTNNAVGCYRVVDFDIDLSPIPVVDILTDLTVCSSFTLPELTNGNYFTEPNGGGMQLNSGDVITSSIRLYIYSSNSEGCEVQVSFRIVVLQSYELEPDYCESFEVPEPPHGTFYTAAGGPNGNGTEIQPGTILTTSQIIYFYSEFGFAPCVDKPIEINIHTPPPVDSLNDVTVCSSYTLPALSNGNYFTESGGNGTSILPGEQVTSTQTLFIFNNDGQCSSETSFMVNIVDTSAFTNISQCGSYTLPELSVGGYFTEPNGNGTALPIGTEITESTTVYYFAETSEGINCTTNLSFDIEVLPEPPLSDHLTDIVRCISVPYELETIEHGSYYTESNGQGTQLNPGDIITSSQTIYVFNSNATCTREYSFNVDIRPLPVIENFTDIFVCDPYVLPNLTNGSYYTEPSGQGTQLNGGDVISTTQTIYIYSGVSDVAQCTSENVFTVNVLGVIVDPLEDVLACDSYTLLPLNVGAYYTEPMGQGTQLFAGDVITSTQTLYIYAENGNRFFCFDNHEFAITITNTPELQNFENKESCGNYMLESINTPEITVAYYREPNGVNLINPADYLLEQPGIYTIHARTFNTNNPNCYVDEVFGVTVHPLKELSIEEAIICVDPDTGLTTQSSVLSSGLDPTRYTVNWYLDNVLMGTGPNFEALEAGTYTVETLKLFPDVGNDCNFAPTQVEVKASKPKAKITFLTEPFDVQTNIKVEFIDLGLGTYQYSLDNGAFQSDNTFLNIPVGDHTITIRDTSNLCGDQVIPFKAVSYPQFFTPNGDGVNDTWNIPDLSNYSEATIRIFDRYGRFIKEIKPSGEGWNGLSGTGNQMPSSSYWFKVDYIFEGEAKSFSSYFALKR